jgi:hypothetical protein
MEIIFLIVPILIAAGFLVFIQLVEMYVAYWAFTHRKSCDCCYDSNGIPNCPSARPNVSSPPTVPAPMPKGEFAVKFFCPPVAVILHEGCGGACVSSLFCGAFYTL